MLNQGMWTPRDRKRPVLVIFGGLPGVGKTVIARKLARQIDAVYVRIDGIEQALRESGKIAGSLDDAGYRVAYAVAEENLCLGRTVVADSVSPLTVTRNAWVEVAKRAQAVAMEVEAKCSDVNEHRRRIQARAGDIPGLHLPTWEEVVAREYQPWDRAHVVIDTAVDTVEQAVRTIRTVLENGEASPEQGVKYNL